MPLQVVNTSTMRDLQTRIVVNNAERNFANGFNRRFFHLSVASFVKSTAYSAWGTVLAIKDLVVHLFRAREHGKFSDLQNLGTSVSILCKSVVMTVASIIATPYDLEILAKERAVRKAHEAAKNVLTVSFVIDLQKDFMTFQGKKGSLSVDGGEDIISDIAKLAGDRRKEGNMVVLSQDWHPIDNMSFATNAGVPEDKLVEGAFLLNGETQVAWSDHCVQGTPGAEFASETVKNAAHYVQQKGTGVDVDSYSVFWDNKKNGKKANETPAMERIMGLNPGVLEFTGLAFDFCVKFSALDAMDYVNQGKLTYRDANGNVQKTRIVVYRNLCRPVFADNLEKVTDELIEAGVEVWDKPANEGGLQLPHSANQ